MTRHHAAVFLAAALVAAASPMAAYAKPRAPQVPPEMLVRPKLLGPVFDISIPVFGDVSSPKVFGSPDGRAVVTWGEPNDNSIHMGFVDPLGRLTPDGPSPRPDWVDWPPSMRLRQPAEQLRSCCRGGQ